MLHHSKALLLFLFLVGIFQSCEMSSDEQNSVPVDFIRKTDSARALEDSTVLVLNFYYQDSSGRPLIDSMRIGKPLYMPYFRSRWDTSGVFFQALGRCRLGDSIHFSLTARQFYIEARGQSQIPSDLNLGENSLIDFRVGFREQMSFEALNAMEDSVYKKRIKDYADNREQRNIEQGILMDQYLEEKRLKAKVTQSGLRFVLLKEGVGEPPSHGDRVSINFKGELLNGYVFGSNMQEGGAPFEFEIGSGEVIEAWDEAVSLMTRGAQAVILVPSDLGRKHRESPVIPGSSVLKYYLELVSVQPRN